MKTRLSQKNRLFAAITLTTVLLSALSCGEDELQEPVSTDYFPLSVGYVWDYYEETASGAIDTLRYEITAVETRTFANDVGEKEVYVVKNTFPESTTTEWRLQYWFDDLTRVDRLQHDIYSDATTLKKSRQYVPGFLRFDKSKMEAGTAWNETMTRYDTVDGTTVSETAEYHFEVTSVTSSVTLKDGTVLADCIQIKRVNLSDGETKEYSFAAGIGKVMETTIGGDSDEKTELLMAIPEWVE